MSAPRCECVAEHFIRSKPFYFYNETKFSDPEKDRGLKGIALLVKASSMLDFLSVLFSESHDLSMLPKLEATDCKMGG
jgi:hypothetical protein